MPRKIEETKILKAKDGTRYIKYKGKKYKIVSEHSDNELIDGIIEIVKLLTKKKRSNTLKKKRSNEGLVGETTGTTGRQQTLDTIALAQLRRDAINPITPPQPLAIEPTPPTTLMTPQPPPSLPPDGYFRVLFSNGTTQLIKTSEMEALQNQIENNKRIRRRVVEQYEEDVRKIKIDTARTYLEKNFEKLFLGAFPNTNITKGGSTIEQGVDDKVRYTNTVGDRKKGHFVKPVDKRELLDSITNEDWLTASDRLDANRIDYKAELRRRLPNRPPIDDELEIVSAEPVTSDPYIAQVDPADDGEPPITDEEIQAGIDNNNNNNQNGEGEAKPYEREGEKGLYGDEITNLMADVPGFLGVVAVDQIPSLPYVPILPQSRTSTYSFIYNTAPLKEKGEHWIAVIVTPTTVEHIDSLGYDPSPEAYENIKKLIGNCPQFKISNTRWQSIKSSNCGYFAMKAIRDRMAGKTFKQVTGWDIVEKSFEGEKNIKKFKEKIKEFGAL